MILLVFVKLGESERKMFQKDSVRRNVYVIFHKLGTIISEEKRSMNFYMSTPLKHCVVKAMTALYKKKKDIPMITKIWEGG